MKKRKLYFLPLLVGVVLGGLFLTGELSPYLSSESGGTSREIKLPPPSYKGELSVEEAIFQRRSIREYKKGALTLEEISQILWAAAGSTIDGITGATRASPSAGACYPIETYLVAGEIKRIPAGIYHYEWREHKLTLVVKGDLRERLARAALGQWMIQEAPVSLVFTAVYPRTLRRYGERGFRYVHMDMGCIAQNVCLQAQALNLGTVTIGAFIDEAVKDILRVKDEQPLCIMPLGRT